MALLFVLIHSMNDIYFIFHKDHCSTEYLQSCLMRKEKKKKMEEGKKGKTATMALHLNATWTASIRSFQFPNAEFCYII